MALLYLTGGGTDLACPACGAGFDLEWNTEYGDAEPGEYRKPCPACGRDIRFAVGVAVQVLNKAPEVPALVAALRALAGVDEVEDGEHGDGPACFFCGGLVEHHGLDQHVSHKSDCILERARAELKAAGY